MDGSDSTRARILKLAKHDEDRELDFEIEWLCSLTTAQRFELMFRKSRELAATLDRHGHRRTAEVVKRT